jgi:hypothetical protein
MKYWLTSVERGDADGVFDVQVTHGSRLIVHRLRVMKLGLGPLYGVETDRRYSADFPGKDGPLALEHLVTWLGRAYRGAALSLPIDLTEIPAREE